MVILGLGSKNPSPQADPAAASPWRPALADHAHAAERTKWHIANEMPKVSRTISQPLRACSYSVPPSCQVLPRLVSTWRNSISFMPNTTSTRVCRRFKPAKAACWSASVRLAGSAKSTNHNGRWVTLGRISSTKRFHISVRPNDIVQLTLAIAWACLNNVISLSLPTVWIKLS